ncbi:hypothetical protein CHUAL_010750 [Chamberlinius hualienensis]
MENRIHAIIHHIDGFVEYDVFDEAIKYLKHQNEAVFLEIQIDKDENLSVYEQHFQNIVDKIIVQCTIFESKTFIYYKHFQNGFVKVDLDTECSTEICQICEELSEQTITFDVIVKGIKIKLFGEFEDTNKSLLTVKFNSLHHLVLIYLSAKSNILALKYFLLMARKSKNLNFKNQFDILNNLIDIKNVLSNEDAICMKLKQILNENFAAEVENGKILNIDFLIKTNSVDINYIKNDKSMTDIAYEHESNDILLLLLKSDFQFPKPFSINNVNKDVKIFIESRYNLHHMIANGNDACLNLIENLDKSKYYLNSNNVSALLTAIKWKKFDIFARLKMKGLQFKNQNEEQSMRLLSKTEIKIIKSMNPLLCPAIQHSSISYLMSKSKVANGVPNDPRMAQIETFYKDLIKNDTVEILFSVIEHFDDLSIKFAFDKQSFSRFNEIFLSLPDNYRACRKGGEIVIVANYFNDDDYEELLGTIVHVITQLVLDIVFHNNCKPYRQSEIEQKNVFTKIVEDMSNKPEIDVILSSVFTNYPHDEWARELAFLSFNNFSDEIQEIEQLDVQFSNLIDFNEIGQQFVVLTTQSPLLTLAKMYQSFCSFKIEFLLVDPERFERFFKQYWKSFICKIFVIQIQLWTSYKSLQWIFTFLSENPGRQIFAVVEESNYQYIEGLIKQCQNDNLNQPSTDLYNHIIDNYSFDDLSDNTKHNIMQATIIFQGKEVELCSLIDEKCNDCVKLIDTDTINRLINKIKLEIGNNPTLSVNYDCYTNLVRSFEIDNQNKPLILTEVELAERFDEFQIVLISGKSGMGKSILFDSLINRLTNENTNNWCIKIDLNSYTSVLDYMQSCETVDELLTVFIDNVLACKKKTRLKTEFERKLLKHFLQNKQNVILMFDEFDEISSYYQKIIMNLLSALKSTKVKQIWIATRPHMINDLEKKLNIKSVKLLKISEQNQINLMINYWTRNEFDYDYGKLQLYAEILIKKFSKLIKDPGFEFSGIPVHTQILADTFKHYVYDCISFNKNELELELEEKISLCDLFEKFIRIIFAINNNDDANFTKSSMNMYAIELFLNSPNFEAAYEENVCFEIAAILTIFPAHYVEMLPGAKDTTFIEGLVKQTGLISEIVNNQPVFIHKSYAEYFTAKYLINNVFTNENQNEDFISLILPDLFHQIQYSIVLQFLNGFIGQLKVDQVKFLLKSIEKYINLEIKIKNKMYEQTILQIALKKDLRHWVWVILNSFHCFFKQTNFSHLNTMRINDLCNTDYETTIRLFGSQLKPHDSDKNKFLKYISHQDEEYNTALHITVAYGHLSIMKLIINHCNFIEINAKKLLNGDKLGNSKLLLFAVDKNKMDIVKYLVDELNIDVNVVSHHNYNITNHTQNPFCSNDFTALHLAAVNNNKPMVDYLLNKYKIDDDECSDDLWSPLQAVAMYGQLDMFKYLIQNGENPNEILNSKVNALHFASLNKEMDIFDYLVKNCDLNVDGKGCFCSPLHIMAEYGHIDKIDHCIEKYGANIYENSVDGRNALHFAAANGQLDTVNYLITKHKIPTNLKCNNADAEFPLHMKDINESLRNFVDDRNNLHEMIKHGKVSDCLNLLGKLEKSKFYLNSSNESALLTAIDTVNSIRRNDLEKQNGVEAEQILEIFARLRINGLQFKNQIEMRCIREMIDQDRETLKFKLDQISSTLKNSSVLYLLSKTKKLNCEMDEIDRAKFERWYKNLTEVKTVDVIFSVVENCDYLSILYDFNDDSVCSANPTVLRKSGIVIRGLTIESEGKVYIGAKQDETIVLGTIAHELTHVAMNMVFDNEGKPYYKDTDSEITMIADQLYENRDKIDKILSNAFTYEKPSWTRELIARVPQMLVALIKDKYPQKRLIIILNKSITIQLGGSEICEMADYSLNSLTLKTHENCFNCVELVSSQTLTNIITGDKGLLKIGKKAPFSQDYKENLYIQRSFDFGVNRENLSVSNEEELIDVVEANNFYIILISDTAGMGKTTVLTKISQLIKNHWLIRINLNNYSKIFDDIIKGLLSFPYNMNDQTLTFFIDKVLSHQPETKLETDFEKNVLHHLIKTKQKVIVMFDGFDEISPNYKNLALKLIQALQDTEIKQIWITTRPNMQKYLEDNLQKKNSGFVLGQKEINKSLTNLITMLNFTHENQINFLVKFWLSEYTWESDVNEKLKLYAEKLIKSLSKAINDNELEFTGNPLITKMLAVVYKDQIKTIITSNKTIPDKLEITSLDSLYDNFINEKYNIHEIEKKQILYHNVRVQEDQDNSKKYYTHNHEIASIMNLFNLEEQNILFNENDKFDSEKLFNLISDGGGNTGIIIQIINNKPQFVHRTFAEYFAKKIIKKILERKSDLRLIEFLLDPGHKGNTFSFLRLFMDDLIGTFTVDEKVKSLLKQLSFVINNMLSQKSDNYNITALHIFACENLKHITWLVLNSFEGFFNLLNFDSNKTISNLCISQEQVSINDKNKTPADIDKFYHYINKQDEEYNTPLHSAVTNGHLSIIKLIINHCNFIGVDVHKLLNGYKLDSNALLLFAVDKNQMHIVKYLVEEVKVNVNVVSHHNYNITNKNIENPFCCDAFTALHIAAVKNNQPMVDYLLTKCHIDGDTSPDDLWTPLQAVAMYGHLDMVQYLIKKGANPKKILKMSNVNALHFASLNKEMDIFDYLVKKCKQRFNEEGCFCSPLHIMAEYGHIDRINYCIKKYGTNINETAMDGRNVLHFAAENGQFEMVKYLITKHKIPINSTCINGKTVLHYAVSNCGRNLYSKFLIIEFLIKIHKADINARDYSKKTPLDEAQMSEIDHYDKDHDEMVKYLEKYGAKSGSHLKRFCWLL